MTVQASNLFHSDKRALGTLVGVGIVAGVISGLVKSGVETLLPPRLPTAVPPPIELLNMMGFDAASMNYVFNQTSVNWGGNGVHILFSIVIAVVYVWLAERCSKVTFAWGVPFGWITATIGAHCIVLPLMGAEPPLWDTGTAAVISEVVGTAIWIWTIECVRRALLGRATG